MQSLALIYLDAKKVCYIGILDPLCSPFYMIKQDCLVLGSCVSDFEVVEGGGPYDSSLNVGIGYPTLPSDILRWGIHK